MDTVFIPELDGTPELDDEERTYYQELIGILHWATELGRIDILYEVSILSQYQSAPRQGHMEQIMHIFGYLKKYPKITIYMDPTFPIIDYGDFNTNPNDFKEYYRDAHDELPMNMPRPRGRSVTTTAFVDASFAQNKKTRKSHMGFKIFVNRAPIIWFSKKQSTVEASTFSAEFIALKMCLHSIESLRFKLRMLEVPVDGPTYVFCDNKSAVNNSSKVESMLDKKHSSVVYHYVRNAVAAGIVSVAWIDGKENLADPLTKRLSETVRSYLFGNWMY